MSPPSRFETTQGRSTFWHELATRDSLQRQLIARVALVFLLVTLSGSLLVLLGYQTLAQQTQRRSADEAAQHLTRRYQAQQDYWLRNADEVKAQIDFMRIFAGQNRQDSWLRLRAFFAALEGKLDRFPSGVVLDPQGRPVFRYGLEGEALEQRFLADPNLARWFYSPQRHSLHEVVSVPLWLGQQGQGRLVLLQPVDNGVLRQLGAPDIRLYLVHEGRVLASAGGAQDYQRQVAVDYSGPLDDEGGQRHEQRVLSLYDP
ncbi:MAG: hypothetical protein VW475_13225, partial [Curvibacter sp.]